MVCHISKSLSPSQMCCKVLKLGCAPGTFCHTLKGSPVGSGVTEFVIWVGVGKRPNYLIYFKIPPLSMSKLLTSADVGWDY